MNPGSVPIPLLLVLCTLHCTGVAEETAALIVDSRPRRCSITCESLGMDSVRKTEAEQPFVGLPPGEHELTFISKGRKLSLEVTLSAGHTVHVKADFTSSEVQVLSDIEGLPEIQREHAAKGVKTVSHTLQWLCDHQSVDGSWDVDGFEARCKGLGHDPCGGAGTVATGDVAVTGLVVMGLLGAGNSLAAGDASPVVERGVEFLVEAQDEDGCLGKREGPYMFGHVIAGLALTECYALSDKPESLAAHVESALAFLDASRNESGGWGYESADGDSNLIVTGWGVMFMKSADVAGFEVPADCTGGALELVEALTDPQSWQVGYRKLGDAVSPGKKILTRCEIPEAMTATAGISRVFLGAKRDDPALGGAVRRIYQRLPLWDPEAGSVDYYYWYQGTLLSFQMGDEYWDRWQAAVAKALVSNMAGEGGRKGSWEPHGHWGHDYGRVATTAFSGLALEIYYRYGDPGK